ncbi:hypothetical protein RRF57_009377 [Xylaria bambusicola]|uniref:Uncharacterized protein n=1 Tax=Xylaria bambusicola TaxID=326684 RepID=A0AAN7UUW0_9PEZI
MGTISPGPPVLKGGLVASHSNVFVEVLVLSVAVQAVIVRVHVRSRELHVVVVISGYFRTLHLCEQYEAVVFSRQDWSGSSLPPAPPPSLRNPIRFDGPGGHNNGGPMHGRIRPPPPPPPPQNFSHCFPHF